MWDILFCVRIELLPVLLKLFLILGVVWETSVQKNSTLEKAFNNPKILTASLKCPSLGAMLNVARLMLA